MYMCSVYLFYLLFILDVPPTYQGRYLKEELCKHISTQYSQIQSESKEDDSKQNYNNNNRNQNGKKSGRGGNNNKGGKGNDSKREAMLRKWMKFKK